MNQNTTTAGPDASDVADELTERRCANTDYTAAIPPITGTIPAEEYNYLLGCDEDDYLAEVAADKAFAEALERRAETGTWWGR